MRRHITIEWEEPSEEDLACLPEPPKTEYTTPAQRVWSIIEFSLPKAWDRCWDIRVSGPWDDDTWTVLIDGAVRSERG
jgi:hypothetical protein